ncbi:MAG: hypothetical protein J0L59_02490 [Xanthomonadales bacterium]|nr:hypothetical protein [Xanthomonadales bacterium]
MSQLVSLQGYLFLAERTPTGAPGRMWWAGNVPEAQLELSEEKEEKNESFSGGRALYDTLSTQSRGRLTGIFDEWKPKNLALGLYATPLDIAGASVTGEELPEGLLVGDYFSLRHPYASSLVITDSAGTPVTVDAENYKAAGHNARTYEVVENLATYTQPLLAAYTYAAAEGIEVFSTQPREIYVIFDGINTRTGQPVTYDLYRTKFDLFENVGLIHEGYGQLNFGADILIDVLNLDVNGKGGYYRMTRKVLTP